MIVEFLREQIERCRRLAKHADPCTEKRLLDLAAEYETRIFELEKKLSSVAGIAASETGRAEPRLIAADAIARRLPLAPIG